MCIVVPFVRVANAYQVLSTLIRPGSGKLEEMTGPDSDRVSRSELNTSLSDLPSRRTMGAAEAKKERLRARNSRVDIARHRYILDKE